MAAEKKHIFVVGLKVPEGGHGDLTQEKLKGMVAEQTEKLDKMGFQVTPYFTTPENPTMIDDVKELLKSRQWDGVGAGFGLRGTASLTPLFEQVVNVFVAHAKTARMIFPSYPTDIADAVQRVFVDA